MSESSDKKIGRSWEDIRRAQRLRLVKEAIGIQITFGKIASLDESQFLKFKAAHAEYHKHRDGSIVEFAKAVRELKEIFEGL